MSLHKYDPRMALRLFKTRTGDSSIKGQSFSADTQPQELQSHSSDKTEYNEQLVTSTSEEVTLYDAPPENDDIWKRRFIKRLGNTKWRRFKRMVKKGSAFVAKLGDKSYSLDERLWMVQHLRYWDDEDLSTYRREKEKAKLGRFHIEQAKLLKRTIIETLVRLKFRTAVLKNDREYIKKKPRITNVEVTETAYTYYVSVGDLIGIKETDMVQPEVATILSIAIRKNVSAELDPKGGLRYRVAIASTLNVPNFVEWGDVINSMPKSLPILGLCVGKGPNGKLIYKDLADAPHLLIAGTSGGGKSNAENFIASTFISRNSPNLLQLVFVDLKGGVEFGLYEGLPHLFKKISKHETVKKKQVEIERPYDKTGWDEYDYDTWKQNGSPATYKSLEYEETRQSVDAVCDGIVEFPEQAMSAFYALQEECNERLALLKKSRVKNIAEYNRAKHEKNRLPYIVVLVDEWATTKRLVGNEIEEVMETLANLSRAIGIHFVIASQNPKAEIINTAITVNFNWRLAFNMSNAASQAVLGNWNASGLSPKGRCIFVSDAGEMEVQTPFITNATVKSIIKEAMTGEKVYEREAAVDIEEILQWANENTGGKLTFALIWEQFRERITKSKLLDLLASSDNKDFDVNGTMYHIKPGYAGFPRQIVRVDETSGTRDMEQENQKESESISE